MYQVIKNGICIAKYPVVHVLASGALDCERVSGGRSLLFLAPGQWDSVFWEIED